MSMKQFLSLMDGMSEYTQLKAAIEAGRTPVSMTGAAAAHKTHIIASLRAQLDRTSIQEPDGTIHKVTRRTDAKKPRS